MSYEYTDEELHGRALYSFEKESQPIVIAFEPGEGDSYMVIVWSDDGDNILNPHDPIFHKTLNEIVYRFDDGRELDYDIAVI